MFVKPATEKERKRSKEKCEDADLVVDEKEKGVWQQIDLAVVEIVLNWINL